MYQKLVESGRRGDSEDHNFSGKPDIHNTNLAHASKCTYNICTQGLFFMRQGWAMGLWHARHALSARVFCD